jgi:hypothetical protein
MTAQRTCQNWTKLLVIDLISLNGEPLRKSMQSPSLQDKIWLALGEEFKILRETLAEVM